MKTRDRLNSKDFERENLDRAASQQAFLGISSRIKKDARWQKARIWSSVTLWALSFCFFAEYRINSLRISEYAMPTRILGPSARYSIDYTHAMNPNDEFIRMKIIFGALFCVALLFACLATMLAFRRSLIRGQWKLGRQIRETKSALTKLEIKTTAGRPPANRG